MTRGSIAIKGTISLLAILAISIGLFASAYLARREIVDPGTAELASARNRLLREVEIEKNRRVPLRLPQRSLDADERSELIVSASNAIAMQDLEGFWAVIMDLDGGDPKPASSDDRLKSLKIAGADLFAARARKRRFEADRLLDDIVGTRAALASQPSSSVLQNRLGLMDEMRTVLLSEYSADTKYSIELNTDNARAPYDLARFYQDKHTRFDDLVAIRYFEKAESLMRGKTEKDADFVRAILNLAILYHAVGNMAKARCYAAETIEKYKVRGNQDLVYLFALDPNGNPNEPEFIAANDQVNPERSSAHADCKLVK